jgi:hypothetical protein
MPSPSLPKNLVILSEAKDPCIPLLPLSVLPLPVLLPGARSE